MIFVADKTTFEDGEYRNVLAPENTLYPPDHLWPSSGLNESEFGDNLYVTGIDNAKIFLNYWHAYAYSLHLENK